MLLSLLLDLGLLQVTCYLPDGEATPWAIVEDECIWCIFWPFLRQSKLMSPSFLRLKTRWHRLRHHRQHQQASHWWPEENDHYLGGTKVKNPLTPAAAPPTASASQPLVTWRKWSLFGGYGRNPNCSNNQGWIGQRWHYLILLPQSWWVFPIDSTLQEVRPSRLAPFSLDGLDGSRLLNLTSPHGYW